MKKHKLNPQQREQAVQLHKEGMSFGEIAKVYGVSRQNIHQLTTRKKRKKDTR